MSKIPGVEKIELDLHVSWAAKKNQKLSTICQMRI